MSQLQLSVLACHRVLKLARTIADLAGSETIGPAHLAEARSTGQGEWGADEGLIYPAGPSLY